ncbi:DUF58 domain-containing protein [Clavibacter zhangzhiyongii]|uniref:DUF58 domain-containing protein n=1 Tax=Clavibacter zhangzhiyongii TaxID=2768071 RepID=UPI0039E0617D
MRRESAEAAATRLLVHPRTLAMPSTSTGFVRDLEGRATRDLTDSDVSFQSLREYVPGDAVRHIHWRSTAKTGVHMVRRFEETRRSHMMVALSLHAGDYGAPEAEAEAGAAAADGARAASASSAPGGVAGSAVPAGGTTVAAGRSEGGLAGSAADAEFELAVSVVGSLGARAIVDARTVSVVASADRAGRARPPPPDRAHVAGPRAHGRPVRARPIPLRAPGPPRHRHAHPPPRRPRRHRRRRPRRRRRGARARGRRRGRGRLRRLPRLRHGAAPARSAPPPSASRPASRWSRSCATPRPSPPCGASATSRCSPSATSTTCARRCGGARRERGGRSARGSRVGRGRRIRRSSPRVVGRARRRSLRRAPRIPRPRPHARPRPGRWPCSPASRPRPFWPVHQDASFVRMAAITLAAGLAIVAVAGARLRWGSAVVAGAVLVAFLALGVPLAVPTRAVDGWRPTLAGLRDLVEGASLGVVRLLTIALPVGDYQALLVPAFALVLLGSVDRPHRGAAVPAARSSR